jgi:rsbT co-antagonist protein RsbR
MSRFHPPAPGAGLTDFWTVYASHYQEIGRATLALLQAEPGLLEVIQTFANRQPPERLRDLLGEAIRSGDWTAYAAGQSKLGAYYAELGLAFNIWFPALRAFRSAMREHLLAAYGPTQRFVDSVVSLADVIDMMLAVITEEYLEQREAIIREQEAIRELSTPVLCPKRGILVAPAVGVFDAARAEQLTRRLLDAIADQGARAVVIDVTGIHTIDEFVATHIGRTVAACRVMGAVAVLTGLSPANATILGRAGLDLGAIVTASNLEDGISRAEALSSSGKF